MALQEFLHGSDKRKKRQSVGIVIGIKRAQLEHWPDAFKHTGNARNRMVGQTLQFGVHEVYVSARVSEQVEDYSRSLLMIHSILLMTVENRKGEGKVEND
jgi:hypothetical protein